MSDDERLKTCNRCKRAKARSEFSKRASASDGLQYKCKACAKAYRDARIDEVRERDRKYRAENREELNAKQRAAYAADPEKVLVRNREWVKRNPHKVRLARRDYARRNVEKFSATSAEWRKNNRERRREIVAKHDAKTKIMRRFYVRVKRARELGCPVALPAKSAVEAKVEYYSGKCYICGDPWECFDHVKPLSKMGPHMLSNMKPCCNPCNRAKHNAWPFDWRRRSQT